MGIYLPNMDMPRKGEMIVIFPDGTTYVCFNGKRERLAQAEVVLVPAHGRLGDLDELAQDAYRRMLECEKYKRPDEKPYEVLRAIELAPTVIPAEEEKECK